MDGEFFRPEHLTRERSIRRHNAEQIAALADITNGSTPSGYAEDGCIAFVRSGDLTTALIDGKRADRFLRATSENKAISLQRGDVLISSIGMGSIGKVSLVVDPKNLSTVAEVTIVRSKGIAPEFLWAYLSTSAGLGEIERRVTGATGQQHLNKREAERILVPTRIPNGFVDKLARDIAEAEIKSTESVASLAKAEGRLISELGLDGLDLSPNKIYARSIRDLSKGSRFDAEYFDPKYDALLDQIKEVGSVRLGDLLRSPVVRGMQPNYEDNGDTLVINSQHVQKTELILDNNRFAHSADLKKLSSRALVEPGDVLLNSTGYVTIGRSQPVLSPVDAMVDSHIAILKPSIEPAFLSVFLNSPAGYLQTERNWTGSSGQIELSIRSIEDFVIWLPDTNVQKEIANLYQDSLTARREATDLLEQAKRRAEELIESGG